MFLKYYTYTKSFFFLFPSLLYLLFYTPLFRSLFNRSATFTKRCQIVPKALYNTIIIYHRIRNTMRNCTIGLPLINFRFTWIRKMTLRLYKTVQNVVIPSCIIWDTPVFDFSPLKGLIWNMDKVQISVIKLYSVFSEMFANYSLS